MTPVQAIRQKCLDCSGGSSHEVKHCVVTRCTLYPFRLGRNPNRKGVKKGQNSEITLVNVKRKTKGVS